MRKIRLFEELLQRVCNRILWSIVNLFLSLDSLFIGVLDYFFIFFFHIFSHIFFHKIFPHFPEIFSKSNSTNLKFNDNNRRFTLMLIDFTFLHFYGILIHFNGRSYYQLRYLSAESLLLNFF